MSAPTPVFDVESALRALKRGAEHLEAWPAVIVDDAGGLDALDHLLGDGLRALHELRATQAHPLGQRCTLCADRLVVTCPHCAGVHKPIPCPLCDDLGHVPCNGMELLPDEEVLW